MIRKTVLTLFAATLIAGCSDSASDSKQPKLQGSPDPKIKEPSKPVGGANNQPAAVK